MTTTLHRETPTIVRYMVIFGTCGPAIIFSVKGATDLTMSGTLQSVCYEPFLSLVFSFHISLKT